jgi:POT family proton-dependent oligopeptide transporter
MWYDYDHKANFFWINFILLIIATLFAVFLLKWLNAIMREKNVN